MQDRMAMDIWMFADLDPKYAFGHTQVSSPCRQKPDWGSDVILRCPKRSNQKATTSMHYLLPKRCQIQTNEIHINSLLKLSNYF